MIAMKTSERLVINYKWSKLCCWITMMMMVSQCMWIRYHAEAEQLVVMSHDTGSSPGAPQSPPGTLQQFNSWGLADASADVGAIFKYRIPKDAFPAPVNDYLVSEVGGSELPSWLYYNSSSHVIEGVAIASSNVMKQSDYLIQVTALHNWDERSTDAFNIHLRNYSTTTDGRKSSEEDNFSGLPDRVLCPAGSSVTSASVILDVDILQLAAAEQVRLLELLGDHLHLSKSSLRYVSSRDGAEVIDSQALVAGPGDVTVAGDTSHASVVRWEVGCGSVMSPHMDILLVLEVSAKDGSMHKALSYGVIGWYVTNKKSAVETRANKIKRQARLRVMSTPTLARTLSPPPTRFVPTRVLPPSSVRPTDLPQRNRTTISPTPSRVIEPTRTSPISHAPTTTPSTTTRATVQPSTPIISRQREQSRTTTLPTTPPGVAQSTKGMLSSTSKATEEPGQPVKRRHDLTVGDILNYAIPHDAFRLFRHQSFLIMKFVTSPGGAPLLSDSWISYDDVQHVLFGIPTDRDIGRHEYQLTAHDPESNRSETIPFEVIVKPMSQDSVTYETYVTLDEDYQEFMESVEQKRGVKVGSIVAAAYGDHDSSSIVVLKVEKGSVVYYWTNKTTQRSSSAQCPVKEVNSLMDRVVTVDGKVDEAFLESMKPYRVMAAGGEGRGVCNGLVVSRRGVVDPDVHPKTAQADTTKALIIAIAVIIAAIAVFVIIVCIWCCRKQRRQKKYSCADDKRNGSSVSKGVPVILATDLEDNKPMNGGSGRSKVVRANTGSSDTLSADSVDRKPMPPGYSSPAIARAEHSQPLLSGYDDRAGGEAERKSAHQTTFKPYPR